MKFAAFACLASLIGASAFVAPAPKQTRSRGMARMAVDDLIGADVETGGIFDPLNFSKDAEKLDKYRAVELKHGRVAMLGVLGIWIQAAGLHLPDPVFSNPRPLAAFLQVSFSHHFYPSSLPPFLPPSLPPSLPP
ncbi:light harvesting complex protein [Nannochloropsis gaditana]|uniref:Light harvesting complex protein n=1 Tax=Nannochloropsis gaditana TaxID=72520 RepID=W7TI84_9STRA|nr:light harvesting complex protein [Nannochloropsis gaditana]